MKMSATTSTLPDDINNKELLDENQYIHTSNGNLLPRMDSGGLLDVATAAGLYLSGGSGVLPPPDQYPPEEILSAQDLTEEDRKLAAALVAVQFVQQQKQQQLLLHDATVSSVSNTSEVAHNSLSNLANIAPDKIGPIDDNLVDTQLLFTHESKSSMHSVPMSQYSCSLGNNRLSPIKLTNGNAGVSTNNLGILNQNTRKGHYNRSRTSKRVTNKHSISGGMRAPSRYSLLPSTSSATSNLLETDDFDISIKSEDDDLPDFSDELDSEFDDNIIETHTAKKSLPHKKRISRKLKTNPTTKNLPSSKNTNFYSKCVKCTKCGEPVRNAKEANKASDELVQKNGPATFHCQLCSQVFNNQLVFFQHLKSHYEPETVLQKQRSDEILHAENLKQMDGMKQGSMMVSFSAFSSLKCSECDKTFRRQKAFDAHIRDAHPKVHKMEMEEFSETEDLMEGIRVVVDGESCGNDDGVNVLTNPSQEDLDHMVSLRNAHTQQMLSNSNVIVSDSKVWYREDDELHATEADLQELEAQQLKEQQIQLEQSLTSYICNLCGAGFEQRIYLTQHMSECYLVLKQEADLLNSPSHVMGKLENEEEGVMDVKDLINKKYRKKKGQLMCTICDRVFNHRNSLLYHLRSHSGERPHQCEECGKSFFATSALKVHKRLHSGDKPYKCEFCGRHFRQWGDLKYHCISLHSNQRQYQCEYCGKDFARKYSLIVHRRIHTGEKNYQCEYCKKTFRASSYLQNHRKIHTGEKPHPCEICGKPFRVRSDMKRHMNTHNRDRFSKGGPNDIKTNASSDSDQADHSEMSIKPTTENETNETNLKEKEINIPLVPKTEASLKSDPLQTPKEEDISAGTLYTVPGDPLTIKEGNNTVYVWPVVYMG